METPQIRPGSGGAWLELVQAGEDSWRVTADWCSSLSADDTAHLTRDEVSDFAAQVLSHLRSPSGSRFSAAVTLAPDHGVLFSRQCLDEFLGRGDVEAGIDSEKSWLGQIIGLAG